MKRAYDLMLDGFRSFLPISEPRQIHVAVHESVLRGSFLPGINPTLQLVAQHFEHDHWKQTICVKTRCGGLSILPLTTPLSRLRRLGADGDGSQDRPFRVLIERSGAVGAGAGAGGGAGDTGRRLATMDEERVRELIHQEMRQSHPPGDSHGTTSELGNSIKERARKEDLVRVTPAGRGLAEAWLNAAGPAGATFARVTEAQSQLLERSLATHSPSLQKVVSAFLKSKKWGRHECRRMWDTHDACSVCGDSLKPDIVISSGSDKPLPSSTVAVVDIKRQDVPYNNGANVYQLVQFGAALFNQLPPTSRTFLLLGVTDFKTIQFLGITRDKNNAFSYQLSSVMPNVLDVLCSILASADAGANDARCNLSVPPQFGAMEPPQLTFNGQRLRLVSVLGRGATATVYGCKLGKQQLAAKVLNNPVPATGNAAGLAAHEVAMLQRLSGCRGIVQLVGVLDGGRGLLLQPVGKALRLREPLEKQKLSKAMEGLLSTIRSVHERGVVHRDLRSSNLLLVEDKDRDAVLVMDWGYAVLHASDDAPEFAGALLCASDRVLEALESGCTLQPEFADDLETLVKSLLLLLNPPVDSQLHRLATPPLPGDVRKFWVSLFEARPSWQDILSLARARDYDALGKALRGKFE